MSPVCIGRTHNVNKKEGGALKSLKEKQWTGFIVIIFRLTLL